MKKLSLLLVIILICGVLTGCWDKVEIEERLFVLAMGIDKADESEKNTNNAGYHVSFVSPIVGALMEGGENTFHTYKTVGDEITMCLSQMYSRFAKRLSFQHSRILIFGEELVKDDELFKEALDAIGRTHDFHKSLYVFVVPGRAEEVFDVKPKYEKLLADYIAGVADNEVYVGKISKKTAFEMYREFSINDGNTLLPTLIPSESETKAGGVAVIKDYKLVDYISENDSMYTNWLTGEAEGGIIRAKYKNIVTPFRYSEFKRSIKLDKIEDDKVILTYNFETEGFIEEYIWPKDLLYQEILLVIEKDIEKTIIENSERIVKKIKDEYKVDFIGAEEYLYKFHNDIYEKLKQKSDTNILDSIVINIEADVKIRRVGIIE